MLRISKIDNHLPAQPQNPATMHMLSSITRALIRAEPTITAAMIVVWAGINAPISLHGQAMSEAANNLHHDISPDSTRIVFESDRDGNSEIYLMNIDGSNLKRLTNNPAIDTAPVWSRDGRKILFRSTRETNRHPWPYYAINPDGTAPVKVDDVDDYAEVFRRWSRDRTQVLLFKQAAAHALIGFLWPPNM